MAGPGRRCVLLDRPEIIEQVSASLRDGLTLRLACQAVGIHADTAGRWMRKARKLRATGRENESPESMLLCRFHAEAKKGEAEGLGELVGIIRSAARAGTWQAAAWLLERRCRLEYGKDCADDIGDGSEDKARVAIAVDGLKLPPAKGAPVPR